jgi:hypothetical protein
MTIGNVDGTFVQKLLFNPFVYKVFMFIKCYYILPVLPPNTKNMTVLTCDKENGTFMASTHQYLKSSATKLHNLCSTTISKNSTPRVYFVGEKGFVVV